MVSGENSNIQLVNNNVSFVGGNGIAVLARRGFQFNSFHEPVLSHLLISRDVNISSNQVHHFGQQVAHSAAIMVIGSLQSTVQGNLIFGAPNSTATTTRALTRPALFPAAAYHIANANGANYENVLSSQYEVTVPLLGFDISTVAKLVALIRVSGSGVAWADATSREVVVRPGDSLDLAVDSSAYFNSIVDVYLDFHVVTPNQILDLSSHAKWRIRTRSCQYAELAYQETCSGPCVQDDGCGNSNAALQQALGTTLACASGYESDPTSLMCTGPFEASYDCDGTGVAKAHLYYDCSIDCFATTCT
ncbi:hypothetical protein BBO99_00005511 [Phytophthora kernoviae]|uniref:Uncharacterized protein n=2 Tax=Phytophthora kernoviae TaxID=325452 RepID=A0A421FCM0_9STRA|nr:hypothetical protein G195_006214 [Phytophthora kernoviae 00238/432]KAG2523438.1 hypothetical protein JM16_005329 [Phytophthora kernoviae]KAG2525292.1 hypothetical protein JM18_004761 [Phytophthora kernoviae]RLN37263.1 hypothetical protein BBI17_005600 [Phytophthora kernoviae]RLN79106.1 hypothetical protein BBO99_00005511 [Phytophthora kernoviae]